MSIVAISEANKLARLDRGGHYELECSIDGSLGTISGIDAYMKLTGEVAPLLRRGRCRDVFPSPCSIYVHPRSLALSVLPPPCAHLA
jgi:hypothetical protein